MNRYLCSELVVLRRGDAEMVVNLEEIWADGAAVEADEGLPAGAEVELRCGGDRFAGTVTASDAHEFGCRMEIGFGTGTLWSPERYRPGHLMNPGELPVGGEGA